jgi:O-antigen/teichoic acid export membrane protein
MLRIVWQNLWFQGLPAVVGLFTFSLFIRTLDGSRFSFFTLGINLVGTFTVLDLGLSRVLTKYVSEKIAQLSNHVPEGSNRPAEAEIGPFFRQVIKLVMISTVVGSVGLACAAGYLTENYFNIAPELRNEARLAILIIALTLPLVTLGALFRGAAEALHFFRETNWSQFLVGMGNFILPLAVSRWTSRLDYIFIALLGSRLLGLPLLYIKLRPWIWQKISLRQTRVHFREILHYGGWISTYSLLSPLLSYGDKLVIGKLLPMAVILFYTTPFEMATKLWLGPMAVTRFVMPSLGHLYTKGDAHLARVYARALMIVFCIVFPACLILSVGTQKIFLLWLRDPVVAQRFYDNSHVVFGVLLAGVLFNSLSWISYAFLQVSPRSDLSAKITLLEIPLSLGLYYFFTRYAGLEGMAWAWMVRVVLDFILIQSVTAGKFAKIRGHLTTPILAATAGLMILMLSLRAESDGLKFLILGAGAVLYASSMLTYYFRVEKGR